MIKKIAVLGASGFVGSTFTQRLLAEGRYELKPFIHDSGNAWGLARLGIPLHQVDLLSPSDLDEALTGCTHVVNCTRGSSEVMVQGIKNVIESCKRRNIQRLIHLSSVAVYHGDFPAEPITESFPGRADKGTYGDKKRQQDDLIESAATQGVSSIVLCPPNISGVGSLFLTNLVDLLRQGTLALVDGGVRPCGLVDVENLVHAMKLALTCDHADGQRIFVTDRCTHSWADMVNAYKDLADPTPLPPSITQDEAEEVCRPPSAPKRSLVKSVKFLVNSDLREVLRRDPWFATMERSAKSVAKKLPGSIQDRLQKTSDHKMAFAKNDSPLATGPVGQQLRAATYCLDRAENVLGYEPVVDADASRAAFSNWYRSYFGIDSGFADLLRT